jgi:SPP1 family predicted phage head-tail adaptor
MLFAETANLIKQTFTVNAVGDSIAAETSRTVFVEFQSIGLKRKIDALATGLNVEFKLLLKDIAEYDDEKIIEYKGKRYNVKNVFIRDDQAVELTVGEY